MASVLGNVIQFFDKIGIYDVVLPFLLVFTIVFAILERTKVFGTESIDGKEYSKKNLNSMAAFVIALLVVASSQLVETLTSISSQVVVLILLAVFFMALIGIFYKEGDLLEKGLEGGWKILFMVIMFIGLVFIFLNAIKTQSGYTWLELTVGFLSEFYTSTAVATILLMIFIIGFMYIIVGRSSPKEDKGK